MYNDDNELTRDEIAALSTLPREMQPSDLLEERVVLALRSQGHLGATARSRPRRAISLALKIAAGIALFAGGVATGRYLIAADLPQSASVAAPSTIVKDRDTTVPRVEPRQVRTGKESIIAEREMWL